MKSVYIPQVDGKDLFLSNCSSGATDGYNLLTTNGVFNYNRFRATFDYSLDLEKLRIIHSNICKEEVFSVFENGKEYSPVIVNVTFNYSIKTYNRTGNNAYLKFGHSYSDIVKWVDCLGYDNQGDMIGVQVDKLIENPLVIAPKYFDIVDGQYKAKTNIKCEKNVAEVRKFLYKNGFRCNGKRYVRWKRSSGSARVGRCLFIDERLYDEFHKWELCGLDIKNGDAVDLAALESYISLTSSSIIGHLNIARENILLIQDYTSAFKDDVVNVYEENGRLQAKKEKIVVENSIWVTKLLRNIYKII